MDEALRFAYQNADYLVCVDTVEWACIRIDQPLPASLAQRVGSRCWAFITACNPCSQSREAAENLAAQRQLFAALQGLPDATILSAIGIGSDGWHEPSFFVIGADHATLDALGHHHRQNAYVFGNGSEMAQLRWLRD
jgi:hypothetical protein